MMKLAEYLKTVAIADYRQLNVDRSQKENETAYRTHAYP